MRRTRETGGSAPPGRFPAANLLTDANGHRYYIVSIVKETKGSMAAYGALKLSNADAESLDELDKQLYDPGCDTTALRSKRMALINNNLIRLTPFTAKAGKYAFGFMTLEDAQAVMEKKE